MVFCCGNYFRVCTVPKQHSSSERIPSFRWAEVSLTGHWGRAGHIHREHLPPSAMEGVTVIPTGCCWSDGSGQDVGAWCLGGARETYARVKEAILSLRKERWGAGGEGNKWG